MDTRIEKTRAAVIRTATDLLVEGGPAAVTIDAIVARSGVAKSTIYRHWSSRDDVLIDVIESCAPVMPAPDPSLGFEKGLRQLGRQLTGILNDPEWARIIPALLTLRTHADGIADLEERLEKRQEDVLAALLTRGAHEGLLRADYIVAEAVAHFYGPFMFGHLTGSVALDDAFVDRTVDRFLDAYAPPA